MGETVSPREDPPELVDQCQVVSPEIIWVHGTYGLNRLYLHIQENTYSNSESKRDHEFEREQRWAHGKDWSKMEEENYITIV